ncbi:sulfotransferase family protein [Desertivirga xinjiangensis]|uniref:sulfotransferase family protein n=1 Tax=Desertivirga xinjiangensis TaxID=539206 RepID=UPI00210B97E6|nr:sulfotransferase [Pedobacter xinjiangensis]
MENISGIQIIGTQRSGSNLLRVILDQSEEIASPHPPHLLITFLPLLPLYGTLNESSYRTLVDDVVEYVKANPVPWEGVILDKEKIFSSSKNYSLPELNRLVYEAAAEAKHSRYWCCKSMANVHHADELEAAGLNLKYVYLFRDGRDVAASFKKAVVGEKHSYHLAKQWTKDQEACLKLEAQLDPARFYKLNYETLIAEPETTVKSLCHFLDITYSEKMLSFYESRTSKLTAEAGEMWSNLKKPIIKDNTGKYLDAFKEDDLEIFESLAGGVLKKLGYQLNTETSSERRSVLFSQDKIGLYDQMNSELKKHTLQTAKPDDLENRKPQEQILKAIKNRYEARN